MYKSGAHYNKKQRSKRRLFKPSGTGGFFKKVYVQAIPKLIEVFTFGR